MKSGIRKAEENELRKKILDHLQKYPRKGIRVVQDWLEEQEPQTVGG